MKPYQKAAALSFLALSCFAAAAEPQDPPAADLTKPVKMYLLSGQSNMTGRAAPGDVRKPAAGQPATLLQYIMAPENVGRFEFLYTGEPGKDLAWAVRDDVFITIGDWPHDGAKEHGKHGGLGIGYGGFRNKGFGPELGIGHVLGDFHNEPVVLVKIAFGANSLGKNFRPPSSGGTLGDKYPLVVKAVTDAIGHLPEIVPGYTKEQGYEISGFFWNQGEHDGSAELSAEYGANLANLIRDLRKDLNAPGMKAVIATTGYGGRDPKNAKTGEPPNGYEYQLKVIEGQLALPQQEEFKGNAATVETRDFWRDPATSGIAGGGDIHWNGNGESYWLVAEAMGKAMIGLEEK